jgi:hypothetical protein
MHAPRIQISVKTQFEHKFFISNLGPQNLKGHISFISSSFLNIQNALDVLEGGLHLFF